MAEVAVGRVPGERTAPSRRCSGVRHAGTIGAMVVIVALVATLVHPPAPRLLWNASASSPRGLYLVTKARRIRRGDMVVAQLPERLRLLADRRRYLPAGTPLVKRVAAARGDRVCAASDAISINGRVAALRRERDPAGRPMPWWAGCNVLRAGELFLLSADAPLAFDGRYFGITRKAEVIGRAHLLWGW